MNDNGFLIARPASHERSPRDWRMILWSVYRPVKLESNCTNAGACSTSVRGWAQVRGPRWKGATEGTADQALYASKRHLHTHQILESEEEELLPFEDAEGAENAHLRRVAAWAGACA